jgi:hypothetical protein
MNKAILLVPELFSLVPEFDFQPKLLQGLILMILVSLEANNETRFLPWIPRLLLHTNTESKVGTPKEVKALKKV